MMARCPHCGMRLDENFLAMMGPEFDCPECDRPIRLDQLHPEESGAMGDSSEASVSEAPLDAPPTEASLSEPPPGSRVECVQRDSQLIILIQPGSNRQVRSLGCFAIFWMVLTGGFTAGMIQFGAMQAFGMPVLFLLFFLGVFWIAGIVILFCWIFGRFAKTYVLIEPDRVVVRTVLFGRDRMQEYPLDATAQAQLTESYRQNDQPVYKISITSSSGKSASFGTFLSDEEKLWLVARINQHLGVPTPPRPRPGQPRRRKTR